MPTLKTALDKAEPKSIHAWIHKHKIKTETGEPLDFEKYQFMFDVYRDNSPLIVCMKAAQIGFTTYEILKVAHECYYRKEDILYVLPTADDVKRFSGGKTNKIIAHNPILQSWTKDKDSVEQKQFGANTIYFQGSWTERAALMITAKKLVIDEYDRCKQDIVEQYDSRLQSIANPKKAFFSNPSIPDFGVSKFYKQSDQKKWHITHSCGETYPMEENCIDYNAQIYRCPKCSEEITDKERQFGEWKATAVGKWSGYWIPLWIAPWMPASKIAEYKKEKTGEYFANFVAGLPYLGGGDKVLASTIINCLNKEVNGHEGRIIIGVDTGLPIHIVLANKQGYFYYGKLSDPTTGKDPYTELEQLLKRWPKSIIVADQGGDLIGIRKLQANYPGRVFLVWYRRDKKTQELMQWGTGEKYGEVVADRNRLIQSFIEEMQDKRVTFNGTEGDWQEYIVHWLNIYRVWEENSLGVKEFKWERQGADHWVHACLAGDTLIQTRRGAIPIRDVQVGDYALTRKGYKRVSYSGIIQKSADVLNASFSNGQTIIATPEHRFWTQSGWKELQNTSTNDILTEWSNYSMERPIDYTKEKDTLQVQREYECTGQFGNFTMAKSLRECMYIIKTIIQQITASLTWSLSILENTLDFTLVIRRLNYSSATYVERNTRRGIVGTIATAQSLAVPSYMNDDTIKSKGCVSSAVLSSSAIPIERQQPALSPVHLRGLVVGIKKIPVYGITVEDTHEYFANGILVANSVYARIGLEKFSETQATVIGGDAFQGIPTGRIFTDG